VEDETKKPIALTNAELRKAIGSSTTAISDWRSGKRPDPLGDPYLEGTWVGKPGGKDVRYVTTPERLGVLKDWRDAITWASRQKKTRPYIKPGRNRGNENITIDDFAEPIEVDGLGPCKLFLRNRSWLHVFDRENRVYRVQASEQFMAELTELGLGEFWPFSDEATCALAAYQREDRNK
jgi:hypothetical protein